MKEIRIETVQEAVQLLVDQHDAAAWKIDILDLKKHLPDEYRKVLNDAHSSVYTMDQRVANQYSFFSVVPSGFEDVDGFLKCTENTVKYVISKNIRWHLRDALDQMNINERMIYPGLDGVAKVEGRHYYVRDESEH